MICHNSAFPMISSFIGSQLGTLWLCPWPDPIELTIINTHTLSHPAYVWNHACDLQGVCTQENLDFYTAHIKWHFPRQKVAADPKDGPIGVSPVEPGRQKPKSGVEQGKFPKQAFGYTIQGRRTWRQWGEPVCTVSSGPGKKYHFYFGLKGSRIRFRWT